MDYSEVSADDVIHTAAFHNRHDKYKVGNPIIMGLKLLQVLSGSNKEVIEVEHDQLWTVAWVDVRENITDYDIKLLSSNGWFINEYSWSCFI